MVKQLHTNKRLLIGLYLSQPYYQTLLIIYQEFPKIMPGHAQRENKNLNLLSLKIINYFTNVNNAKKYGSNQ